MGLYRLDEFLLGDWEMGFQRAIFHFQSWIYDECYFDVHHYYRKS